MSTQPDSDPRDRTKYYFNETPLRRVVLWSTGILLRFGMVLRVEGLEHLPFDGPLIIAANQVTNLDVFPLQLSIPRTVCFMAKAELFKTLWDPILRVLCAFPVHRGEKDEWAFRHATKVLAGGGVLGMFPEGKRSSGRGLGVAKTGTARMAIGMNCPIIPLTIVGSDQVFRQFPSRSYVTVRLLPPILPNPGETALSLTDRLMFSLAAGLPEEMRGVYARVPNGFG